MFFRRSRKGAILAVVCIGCTALVAGLYYFSETRLTRGNAFFIHRIEFAIRDFLAAHGRTCPGNPELVFLAIDAQSVALDTVEPAEMAASPALQRMKEAGWPWPRDVYPLIIDRLLASGAKVVVLDLMFPTAREGDAAFRATLDAHRDRLVIGGNFTIADHEKGGFVTYTIPADSLIEPNEPSDDRIGFVNFWPDADGIIRRATYHTTAAAVSGLSSGPDDAILESLDARALQKSGMGDRVPPGQGARLFRYSSRENGAFTLRSIYEIFVPRFWESADYGRGKVFDGKIVLIGPEGNWSKDVVQTPFGDMAGPELHLQAMNAAWHGEFLSETSWPWNLLMIGAGGLLAWLLASLVQQPVVRLVVMMGAAAVYYGFAQLLYNSPGIYIPVFCPVLAMATSGIAWLTWEQVLERIERARTRRTLERYVSKNLVKEILDNPASYLHALGGSRQDVAVLFSDLRGFTQLTEQADGAELVAQLNEYFTDMVSHVFAQRGTLDKFIGDAVMAVWGNVHSEGPERDVELAVTAASRMQEGLALLNAKWQSGGRPSLAMGIGISHGVAIVGNIGSQEKMELTVIGDTVNLASRLEGLTKEYGVTLLLGENAASHARGKFHLQVVDRVQVKGKTKAIDVFTVIGAANDPLEKDMVEYLRLHEEAIKLYRAMQFKEAAQLFQKALVIRPGDTLATLYLDRCLALGTNPPPYPWDGVFVMTRK